MSVPPYADTVQFVMVDTVTLTSEQNQFPGWGNLPNLYYPPPPVNLGRRLQSEGGAGAGGGAGARVSAEDSGGFFGGGGGAGGRQRRLLDFNMHNPPPISTAQWEWVEHTLSNSTATWIVVVGCARLRPCVPAISRPLTRPPFPRRAPATTRCGPRASTAPRGRWRTSCCR